MIPTTAMFPIAFLIVAAILLWNLIYTRGGWIPKFLLILTVPYLSLVLWLSLNDYLGWPTPEKLPRKSLLVGSLVMEPQPSGDNGGIYLWLLPIEQNEAGGFIRRFFGYQVSGKEPRAYVLPYTRKMHEELDGVMGPLKDGEDVILEPGRGNNGQKEKIPEQNSETDRAQENNSHDDKIFYVLPPQRPPNKD